MQLQSSATILLYMLMFLRVAVLVMEGGGGEVDCKIGVLPSGFVGCFFF